MPHGTSGTALSLVSLRVQVSELQASQALYVAPLLCFMSLFSPQFVSLGHVYCQLSLFVCIIGPLQLNPD